MIAEKRTVIVRDAELHWAKLVRPVEPFGTITVLFSAIIYSSPQC